MPVQEIDNFRQKYPQYSDIDDTALATKLSQKYPQAYGDLPGKVAMSSDMQNPDMKGGANAPALVKARQDVAQKTSQNQNLDILPSAAKGLQNMAWPMSLMYPKGAGQYQPTTGGGQALADAGAIANPLVDLAMGLGGKVAGKVAGAAIKPLKEAYGMSKELSATAKSVGAASKAPDSIVRRMGELKDMAVTPLKDLIESKKSSFQDVKESLQNEIGNKKGLKAGKLEVTKDYQKAMKDNIMADLSKQKESLEEALQGSAEDIAKYMKDAIPEKVKSMNEVFGKHIDEISDAMEKTGKGITNTDRFNILNATKQEADDLGISTGRAKKLLDSLHADATKSVEGEKVPIGIVDASGKPMFSETAGQGSEMIPFRNFIQETRQFRKILSDAKLTGVKGMNDEDIVGAIYNKNVNKYLQENVSGYRSLQKDYAPVINAMKTARRVFRPGDVYSDEQGVNLLKRYATGKASAGKEQLLKDVQGSSRFGDGTKDVTTGLKDIGNKLSAVKSKISTMPKELEAKFSKELDGIRDSHDKEIAALEEKLSKAKEGSQAKTDSIKDQINEIDSHYDARIRHVKDTADKLSQITKKSALAGTLGMLGLGEVARKGEDIKHLIGHL